MAKEDTEGGTMNPGENKFCPQCGADDLAIREITPYRVLELYCQNCGTVVTLLWSDHDLIGSTAQRDPESDSESW
jgi:hypothetical protein